MLEYSDIRALPNGSAMIMLSYQCNASEILVKHDGILLLVSRKSKLSIVMDYMDGMLQLKQT